MAWQFASKRQTKEIKSEDGKYWIKIQKLSQGDKDDLQDLLATMDIVGKDKKQLANMNLGKMKAFERERSVISWNLEDDEGNPVELTKDALRNLPEEVAEEIDKAIDELNPREIPDSKKKL